MWNHWAGRDGREVRRVAMLVHLVGESRDSRREGNHEAFDHSKYVGVLGERNESSCPFQVRRLRPKISCITDLSVRLLSTYPNGLVARKKLCSLQYYVRCLINILGCWRPGEVVQTPVLCILLCRGLLIVVPLSMNIMMGPSMFLSCKRISTFDLEFQEQWNSI